MTDEQDKAVWAEAASGVFATPVQVKQWHCLNCSGIFSTSKQFTKMTCHSCGGNMKLIDEENTND